LGSHYFANIDSKGGFRLRWDAERSPIELPADIEQSTSSSINKQQQLQGKHQ